MLKIGSHVSLKSPKMLLGSVEEAISYGATTFMVYTGAPQSTQRKPVDTFQIEEALELMKKHNIQSSDIVVHAPYIMNLANPDPSKRQFAIDFLTEEVKRTHALNASQIVLHPGAALKQSTAQAIAYIASGLNQVIENTATLDVKIALETMAGKGTEVGRSFEELKSIIDNIDNQSRISVCFDTCHTHDAGYPITTNLSHVFETFDAVIGLEKISVFHINDSKNVEGAQKDRHANIGAGTIGFEVLNTIVNDPRFKAIPKILETPYISEHADAKLRIYPPYREEIEMFKTQKYNPNFINQIRSKNQSSNQEGS